MGFFSDVTSKLKKGDMATKLQKIASDLEASKAKAAKDVMKGAKGHLADLKKAMKELAALKKSMKKDAEKTEIAAVEGLIAKVETGLTAMGVTKDDVLKG